MHPGEGDHWGLVQLLVRPIASGGRDRTTDSEAQYDGRRAHQRRPNEFNDDYGCEDAEAKADELGMTPE